MEPSALNKLLSKLPPDLGQAVSAIVAVQQEAISQRDETIQGLKQRIKELEAQLNQTSRNSSQPPSSDGPKKPPGGRKGKKRKKPGGQARA